MAARQTGCYYDCGVEEYYNIYSRDVFRRLYPVNSFFIFICTIENNCRIFNIQMIEIALVCIYHIHSFSLKEKQGVG